MSSSQKKVIVRRFGGDLRCGYLPTTGFVRDGNVLLLDLEGRRAALPLAEIRTICYVRDFNLNDSANPERLQRRAFLARPRGDGLWLRLTFREDGDLLEGLVAADRVLMDDIAETDGLHLSPPDTRSNTQRVFVPRSAIATLTILAVITSPSARPKPIAMPKPATESTLQEMLFRQEPAAESDSPQGLDESK